MGIEILNTRILTYFDSDFLSLIKITWEIEFYCFIGASYRVANLKISGVNIYPVRFTIHFLFNLYNNFSFTREPRVTPKLQIHDFQLKIAREM